MLKTAKCMCCNATDFTSNMVKVASPKRGERNAYMCDRCATSNQHYHAINNKVLTKQKANNVMCGIEFETSYTNKQARLQMFEYGFIPTHDSSLQSDTSENNYGWYDGTTCEYVSGIMYGLNQASKFCVTCETLIDNGNMSVNDSCGTHFHISIDSMQNAFGEKVYMDMVRRFYNSLFVPLNNAMLSNSEATQKLFGRNFTSYAHAITMSTSTSDRYCFVNCQADTNIEFRLNKFVNAKQYQNLMKFEVEIVKTIITNFCEHFNDIDIDNRRYKNMREYRKHKADVTAKKIVKLFKKYTNN